MDNGKRRNDAHLLRDTIEGRIADDLLSREPRLSDSMQHLIRGLLVVDDKKRWGYEEVVRHLNGEHVAVAQKEVSAWEYSVENTNCTTLEQVGTAIFNNLSSESLRKEIFRGFLVSFFEDKYPDVAKKIDETIEDSASDMELCLKKIALLLNPSLPYITQNGYKIENIDDVVNLILNAPEEMIDVLDAKNKWFYIYFEHLGYKDKIQDILSITKDIDKSSGFNAMLALGKIVVLLRDKAIRPFTQDKYKNITLTDFEQLSTMPIELQINIISMIINQSLEGLILPWFLIVKPELDIKRINEIFVDKNGIIEFSSIQDAIDKAEEREKQRQLEEKARLEKIKQEEAARVAEEEKRRRQEEAERVKREEAAKLAEQEARIAELHRIEQEKILRTINLVEEINVILPKIQNVLNHPPRNRTGLLTSLLNEAYILISRDVFYEKIPNYDVFKDSYNSLYLLNESLIEIENKKAQIKNRKLQKKLEKKERINKKKEERARKKDENRWKKERYKDNAKEISKKVGVIVLEVIIPAALLILGIFLSLFICSWIKHNSSCIRIFGMKLALWKLSGYILAIISLIYGFGYGISTGLKFCLGGFGLGAFIGWLLTTTVGSFIVYIIFAGGLLVLGIIISYVLYDNYFRRVF